MITNNKNRERDYYSFANINLLGKCNVDCFFCLGKDIADKLSCHNQVREPFCNWEHFNDFLCRCTALGIQKIYITGQNTDSFVYPHLQSLVDWLHNCGFQVGLRTNGFNATDDNIRIANKCELSTGYSIHALSPVVNKMILGRDRVPDWEKILNATERPRVSIVINRCNEYEFWNLLKFISNFKHVRYIQARRVSTDTRLELLTPDIAAYERVYTQVASIFGPPSRKFVTDAEEYQIYGMPVVFWRTVKTSVNSINYFTDGTISEEYFVVEGYLKNAK